ncbi:diacylglycerol kinase [Streptomyces olivoreticuli]|uniref:diacylglycerol kinase n=1 Tax=Streptomyces olivoreticuli TaxID=68246 RepID=UPI00265B0384|nr:diacylglycerol kinase [Streptomyces olivoreticuli]WKK20960.1 diacylglycerol kinase [Streptomyces olivoreticuli]
MSAPDSTEQPLLVVIDPVARRVDGESVRIARDVLCGGAVAKICFPEGPQDVERALARRGRRRPVVIGDDRALLRVVHLLHQRRDLPEVPVSLVPVGALPAVSLARALGVPLGTVAASRAVLDGAERRLDALVDDAGGVVLGGLWIPGPGGLNRTPEAMAAAEPNGSPETGIADVADVTEVATPDGGVGDHQSWWSPAARTARSALTLLTGPAARHQLPSCTRLRVEADGVLLVDLDEPVARVALCAVDGQAEVTVHTHSADLPSVTRATRVSISGPSFHYRADNVLTGPVRTRTWSVREGAWRLVLPRG